LSCQIYYKIQTKKLIFVVTKTESMTALTVGDKAPDFSGIDQNENNISLHDFKGKKIILYFYPKDNTPGCTAEACDLRDNYKLWLGKGYAVRVRNHEGEIRD
jgi:peroxiredoxin